jgi:hypothetical protein
MNKLGAMNLFVDLMLLERGGGLERKGTGEGIRNYDKNLKAGRLYCKKNEKHFRAYRN